MKEFYINTHNGVPAYKQIVEEIKSEIANGILKEGDKLPTVRKLAIQIHVNPNTVARAYRELEREGIIETFVGRGTFIKKSSNRIDDKLDILIDRLLLEAKNRKISVKDLIQKIKERGDEK